MALTGGSMGSAIIASVLATPGRSAVDWSRVRVWWGDERYLPAGDPDRNDTQNDEAGLSALGLDPAKVHRVAGPDASESAEASAEAYARTIREHGQKAWDVVLFGVGPDGHVASLFPHHPAQRVTDAIAVAVHDSPKPPPDRVSLTVRMLRAQPRGVVPRRRRRQSRRGEGRARSGRRPVGRPGGPRFEVSGAEVELRVPGHHNILNALSALAALQAAGVAPAEAAPALAKFTGAGRRFEPHGRTERGAEVYDDYAHHPTEVRATLEAARTLEPRRLVAAFQPHLYSRTKMLAREFGESLALADLIVVLDIYRAREHPGDFPGVSGFLVAEAAADATNGRPVWWMPTIDLAEAQLRGELSEGDVLITLGAGNVDELAKRLTA